MLSRLKKREPLIALGSHHGVVFISASAVPHCGKTTEKRPERNVKGRSVAYNTTEIKTRQGRLNSDFRKRA